MQQIVVAGTERGGVVRRRDRELVLELLIGVAVGHRFRGEGREAGRVNLPREGASGTHPLSHPAARHELRPLWPTIVCAADNPCDLASSLAFQCRHVRVLRVVEVGAPIAPGLEIGVGPGLGCVHHDDSRKGKESLPIASASGKAIATRCPHRSTVGCSCAQSAERAVAAGTPHARKGATLGKNRGGAGLAGWSRASGGRCASRPRPCRDRE